MRHLRIPLFSGSVAGIVAAVLVAGYLQGADGRPQNGQQLYAGLAAEAAKGDAAAQEQLSALDAFLAKRGLTVRDLPLPALDNRESEVVDGIRLTVEDASPWRIDIQNATTFADRSQLASYIVQRSSVAQQFANANPARRVEAVVHPQAQVAVGEFLRKLACPCEGISLVADVYAADRWLMSAGRDLSGSRLDLNAEAIELAILDQASASLDLFPGIAPSRLRAEVRMVRIYTTADAAQRTASTDGVLLVDLVTDIADRYGGRAAVVAVGGVPDVAAAYRELVVGRPIGDDALEPVRK